MTNAVTACVDDPAARRGEDVASDTPAGRLSCAPSVPRLIDAGAIEALGLDNELIVLVAPAVSDAG
jgi:hypothetical protein